MARTGHSGLKTLAGKTEGPGWLGPLRHIEKRCDAHAVRLFVSNRRGLAGAGVKLFFSRENDLGC